jgi:hypothetical protein
MFILKGKEIRPPHPAVGKPVSAEVIHSRRKISIASAALLP